MSRVDITANIMVKNEESKIVRCIESIVMFVDEIEDNIAFSSLGE